MNISGIVIKGDGYGRKIGFPTVNLDTQGNHFEVAPGVYTGEAILENKKYRAGIVVGPANKLEAHLINYDGDAYGKTVILFINRFIREYKKFNNEEELINQIKEDLKLC